MIDPYFKTFLYLLKDFLRDTRDLYVNMYYTKKYYKKIIKKAEYITKSSSFQPIISYSFSLFRYIDNLQFPTLKFYCSDNKYHSELNNKISKEFSFCSVRSKKIRWLLLTYIGRK